MLLFDHENETPLILPPNTAPEYTFPPHNVSFGGTVTVNSGITIILNVIVSPEQELRVDIGHELTIAVSMLPVIEFAVNDGILPTPFAPGNPIPDKFVDQLEDVVADGVGLKITAFVDVPLHTV